MVIAAAVIKKIVIQKCIKDLVWWAVKLQFLKRDLLSVVLPWSTCPIVPTLTFGLAAYENRNRWISRHSFSKNSNVSIYLETKEQM